MRQVQGTQGYAERAEDLLPRWARLDVEAVYAPVLSYLENSPGRALDIGVGAGNTAAFLAARGWEVIATEPVTVLRDGAARLQAGKPIRWTTDALPDLAGFKGKAERFDLICCFAVLMHLDEASRRRAILRIDEASRRRAILRMAALLSPGGVLVVSLRHGPPAVGRTMHPVSALQTVQDGRAADLNCRFLEAHPSVQPENRAAGVTWTWLAFEKG